MSHAELRLALGTYVLGALEPAERAEVAEHLEQCGSCRAELAELAPMPGLLARLTPDEARASAVETVPERPLLGALRVMAGRRRGRRRRLVAAAAAVVVLVGVGAGVAADQRRDDSAGVTMSATDPGTGVRASATLRAGTSGTTIALTVSGVPAGERCRLVAVTGDGHREVIGSWRASYAGGASFHASTAMSRAELSRLDVVTFSGRKLVTVPVA